MDREYSQAILPRKSRTAGLGRSAFSQEEITINRGEGGGGGGGTSLSEVDNADCLHNWLLLRCVANGPQEAKEEEKREMPKKKELFVSFLVLRFTTMAGRIGP